MINSKIGTGEYQIFFIDSEGVLYAQGNNNALLGTNNTDSPGKPIPCVQQFGAMPLFSSCYGGLHDGAAIDISGNVWHMGENGTNGLAGLGNTTAQPYATKITVDINGNPFGGVISLASFFSGSAGGWVAVKENGTVWIWGNCTLGFLGDGTDGSIKLAPTQVILPGGKLAKDVVAGKSIFVLCTDGTVLSWGGGCNPYNNSLGYSCSGNSYKSPHLVDNVTNAKGIAGGGNYNWAWNDTTVWFCGYPKHNGTGSTSDNPIESFTNITSSIGLTLPLTTIVTNSACTHAIDANGALWGTGNSPQGELGDGSTLDMSSFNWGWDTATNNIITTWKRVVPERSDFINIYGAMPYTYYSYFETSDGQLYFCGRNKSGISATGEVSGDWLGGGIDSNYPNSWDKPTAIAVNPFTAAEKILKPSPYCVLNPLTGTCSNYSIPLSQPPSVNAGANQTISTSTTTLTAFAEAVPSRVISTYLWTQISGPNTAYIYGINTPSINVSGLIEGTYLFRVSVSDNLGDITEDDILVYVSNVISNTPPTANAGSNQTIQLPTNNVSLTGTGNDSDGTIASYLWTKISGPSTYTITTPTTASTTITGLVQGTYIFRLTVTDNQGATGYDDVQITVNPIAPVNQIPVANAGEDKIITLPNNSTTLIGSGTDSDGTISAYSWTKVSGPTSYLIQNPASSTTIISNLTSGIYIFMLTVTDNNGATGIDTVQVTVNDAPPIKVPKSVKIHLPTRETNILYFKALFQKINTFIASLGNNLLASLLYDINKPYNRFAFLKQRFYKQQFFKEKLAINIY